RPEVAYQVGPLLRIAELFLGADAQTADRTLGLDIAGVHADDAHAIFDAEAAERARERDQSGIAGRAGEIVVVELLRREADDVDDHARTARLHAAIEFAAHVDVSEDLQLPGLTPARVVELEQVAFRDRAGIVDQNVDRAGLLHDGLARLGLREV